MTRPPSPFHTGMERLFVLKLFRFLKPYIPAIVAVFFLTFFQAISELYLPTLMSDIVDNGIVNGDTDYIITVSIRMLVMLF